jgi:gp16 family phage-associated protein
MSKKTETRSLDQFLDELSKKDMSVKDWARQNGLDYNTVYSVLGGRATGRRGKARQTMRAMGLPLPRVARDSAAEAA